MNEARGTNSWLCYPCSTTLKKTNKVDTIGIPAWINRGYDGYEDVTEPVVYCYYCRSTIVTWNLFQPLGSRTLKAPSTILFDIGIVRLDSFSIEKTHGGLADPATMNIYSAYSHYLFYHEF